MQRYLVVTEMGPGQAVGVVTVDSQETENDPRGLPRLVCCHGVNLMDFCSTAKTPRSDCSSQDWLIANLRCSSFLGYYVRNHFQSSKAVRCSRGSEDSLLTTMAMNHSGWVRMSSPGRPKFPILTTCRTDR